MKKPKFSVGDDVAIDCIRRIAAVQAEDDGSFTYKFADDGVFAWIPERCLFGLPTEKTIDKT